MISAFVLIKARPDRIAALASELADVDGVERFCDALGRFLMTVSWGGYESLAFPVCAVFPKDAPLRPANGGAGLNFVRLSIGLEEPAVLIADLEQALARV